MEIIEGRGRLYQDLARILLQELAAGTYAVGARLPAERDLAIQFDVSRPTVREAVIALEVQGFVEVRVGSGAYVLRLPGNEKLSGFAISALELTEARLLFEGEAAALAATQVTADDILQLEALLGEMARENLASDGSVEADRAFHLMIARFSRNKAVEQTIENLWHLRSNSAEAALLHEKARTANIKPVVDEHSAVLQALKNRDAAGARAAMRSHLSAVLDSLLFATEEQAVIEARRSAQQQRARYTLTANRETAQ